MMLAEREKLSTLQRSLSDTSDILSIDPAKVRPLETIVDGYQQVEVDFGKDNKELWWRQIPPSSNLKTQGGETDVIR